MNQRQLKKNYKKKQGVNPPTEKPTQGIDIAPLMRNVVSAGAGTLLCITGLVQSSGKDYAGGQTAAGCAD